MASKTLSREAPADRAGERDLLKAYAPEPNVLERRAFAYLDVNVGEGTLPASRDCRARLKRLQRRTILLGILSGTISGVILGGTEIYINLVVLGGEERSVFDDPFVWGAYYALVGIVTVVEIAFLYWITLKAIVQMKHIVGVPGGHDGTAELLRAALGRAALEVPNPHGDILGVDPHAFTPRWQLLARNLAYKAKVGLTSFVMRIVMRRLLVRAVLRSYLPLLAAPLYAAWNAWILHRIMEEARLRAFGPFAVQSMAETVEAGGQDGAWRRAVTAGIVETVRRSGNAHPNYVLLLHALKRLGIEREAFGVETDGGREALRALPAEARETLSRLLLLAATLAGRPGRGQIGYLRETHSWMDLPFEPEQIGRIRQALREGGDPDA